MLLITIMTLMTLLKYYQVNSIYKYLYSSLNYKKIKWVSKVLTGKAFGLVIAFNFNMYNYIHQLHEEAF